MELVYPFVIYLGAIITILLLIIKFKKSSPYKDGKKVANTKYIKSIPYYQNVMRKYKILSYLIKGICIINILFALLLSARIATIDTSESPLYNRDIFLCMDVSTSVNELNENLVKSLKDIVNGLKGERFGISIFNSSSVLLVPLTNDYDYVLNTLDTLAKSFNLNNDYFSSEYSSENTLYLRAYILDGTLIGSDDRGSSLIGDGLASCIYGFSDLEENRSRVIIFSTDNDLEGTPLLTTSQAADIAKKKNITIFGIAPETIGNTNVTNKTDLQKAVEKTGGTLYIESSRSTVSSIIKNIEQQQKTLLQGQKETKITDYPQVPFVMLIISLLALFILDKKVNL